MFNVFMFDHYLGLPYSHDMCPCTHCFPGKKACHDTCRPDTVSCPLYRDNTIIQQPADLTTLTNTYTQEAVKFIKVKLEIEMLSLLKAIWIDLVNFSIVVKYPIKVLKSEVVVLTLVQVVSEI